MTDFLLSLNGTLQKSLYSTLEIFYLLPLEPLQLCPHQPPHILKSESRRMHPPLRIPNIRTQLVQPILLGLALSEQFVLIVFTLLHLRLGGVPRVESLLSLRKSGFDTSDKSDIFIDGDAKRQDILLRLSFVELSYPEL